MYIVLVPALIVNIASIIVLLVGLFHNFKLPKNKANFGYAVVGCLISYILTLAIATVYKLFIKPDLCCLILSICVISPFITGKFVKHKSLKKYTIIQVLFFLVSLVTLLIKY